MKKVHTGKSHRSQRWGRSNIKHRIVEVLFLMYNSAPLFLTGNNLIDSWSHCDHYSPAIRFVMRQINCFSFAGHFVKLACGIPTMAFQLRLTVLEEL